MTTHCHKGRWWIYVSGSGRASCYARHLKQRTNLPRKYAALRSGESFWQSWFASRYLSTWLGMVIFPGKLPSVLCKLSQRNPLNLQHSCAFKYSTMVANVWWLANVCCWRIIDAFTYLHIAHRVVYCVNRSIYKQLKFSSPYLLTIFGPKQRLHLLRWCFFPTPLKKLWASIIFISSFLPSGCIAIETYRAPKTLDYC